MEPAVPEAFRGEGGTAAALVGVLDAGEMEGMLSSRDE